MNWRKSSYSGGSDCVEVAWRKSSHSVGNGACTEVAVLPGPAVAVRDSKNPGPELKFSPAAWAAFLATVKGAPAGSTAPTLYRNEPWRRSEPVRDARLLG